MSAEKDAPCCAHPKCPGGSLCCCQNAEKDAPTMRQGDCRCPDDCDCDGRFACEDQAGSTTRRCTLTVGHDGWHESGNHRWEPRILPPAE